MKAHPILSDAIHLSQPCAAPAAPAAPVVACAGRRLLTLAALAGPLLGVAACAPALPVQEAEHSAAYAQVVASHIQKCSTPDSLASDQEVARVRLYVDAYGIVRGAQPLDLGPESAATRHGIRTALDRRCAILPLPKALLGQSRTFDIAFHP